MMKPVLYAATAAAALIACMPAAAHTQVYVATLSGAAESPPVTSTGTGRVRVTIDDHDFTMRVQATFADLVGTTTVAHIHCCTALPVTGTAGVATPVPSFPGFPAGVTAGSYDQLFDMTVASSYNPSFLAANGGNTGAAFSALITGIADGKAYLNIHSTFVPSGEIRGFLAPIPEPETYALMLAGLAAVGVAARRRKTTPRH